jgi:polyphosphate glucokinase
MKVLVVDIGGTHIKMAIAGSRRVLKIDSGKDLTPARMVRGVLAATAGWTFDVVSIGYPGPVRDSRPVMEPHNLGKGWRRFDFDRAFGRPVRMVNDAAMQALGSFQGGRMLFLGLGTGMGSAVVDRGRVEPLELAHLPYHDDQTYEDVVGTRGLKRLGLKRWARHVGRVAELLRLALLCDYVVLGGGNVKRLTRLPPRCRRGNNVLAFRGGGRLWNPGPGTSLP